MKILSNGRYNELQNKIKELENKIKYYEDESGETTINKIMSLAKKCGINTADDEYQTMMKRLFLSEAGKNSPVMNAYSKTVFLKDNSSEILDRLSELLDKNNAISGKQIKSPPKKK